MVSGVWALACQVQVGIERCVSLPRIRQIPPNRREPLAEVRVCAHAATVPIDESAGGEGSGAGDAVEVAVGTDGRPDGEPGQ